MKRNKVFIAMLLCFALIASTFCLPAYANPIDNISTSLKTFAPGDTLQMTQNEYLGAAKSVISKSSSDEYKIKAICETFLALAKASVRNPQSYDCTRLIAADSLDKDTVKYRLSEFQYQSALNKALGWEILKDDLSFADYEVKISDNSAVATIVESYTYYVSDGFDDKSFRRKMYTFELLRGSNGWEITNIITDDPWETDENFQYAAIDVKGAVDAQLAKLESKSPPPLEEKKEEVQTDDQASIQRTMYIWTYDESDAVAYAEDHYDDTSNSVFGYTSGDNCQNFASQCVWAGLGGSGTSKTARPAVPTSRVGSDAFNVWCAGQSTTYYNEYYYNWAWDNVCGFSKLMVASTTTDEGPYGNAYYSNGVQYAEIGNVLTVDWNGSPAQSTIDHAMFVTDVTGTVGERTKSNVKIAAHTSATNSAYETLSSYTDEPIGSFARATIWNGYYTVQQ